MRSHSPHLLYLVSTPAFRGLSRPIPRLRRGWPVWLAICLGLGLPSVGFGASVTSIPNASSGDSFMRGVVVSCPRAGQVWGSPDMENTLEELKSLGVGWISIHPYAGLGKDGSIRFRRAGETPYLAKAAELAKAMDMKLFLKPHLAYWGSFEWRGAIDFGTDDEAWGRFFDGYRDFIVDQARFAETHRLPLLSVGVEYERTTRFESRWRQIIASVRRVYSGRITYASNWDSMNKVPFWDALDYIGIHAYFPLSDQGKPDRQELLLAWEGPLQQLSELSRKHGGKPVIFAEIGYPRSPMAAQQPWVAGNDDTPTVRALRKTLIEVALLKIESTPFVSGMFWWKWIPGNNRWDRDFSMKDPEAREPLTQRWGNRGQLLVQ